VQLVARAARAGGGAPSSLRHLPIDSLSCQLHIGTGRGDDPLHFDFVPLCGTTTAVLTELTVDPAPAQGRVYNTTQGLVALHALGVKPQFDPLPVVDEVLRQDYKTLPAYAISFFPLAYLANGTPIPPEADRKIRATMLQGDDGYLNDHIAATFHAAHNCGLVVRSAGAVLFRITGPQG